jgi:hypothetical protein
LINDVLTDANEFLGEKYRPFAEFSVFDDDAVPSNSDVTFIMAQYAAAIDLFRSSHVYMEHGRWYYRIADSTEIVQSTAPASVARKGE